MKIKDKVVIVTGASQGIGEATAKQLSRLGAQVILAARSKGKIENLSQDFKDSLSVVTDMRKRGDIQNLIEKTLEKYGRIDILINNAGQGMQGPVEKIDVKQYKNLMDLNVYGVLEAMQAVIPVMRRQGGGMILNVSSGVTKMYIPGIAAYSSTKYALNSLSLIARQELAKDKIIVSVVHPGMTATNFYENMIGGAPDFSGAFCLPWTVRKKWPPRSRNSLVPNPLNWKFEKARFIYTTAVRRFFWVLRLDFWPEICQYPMLHLLLSAFFSGQEGGLSQNYFCCIIGAENRQPSR